MDTFNPQQQSSNQLGNTDSQRLIELEAEVFHAGQALRIAQSNLCAARQRWESALAAVHAATTPTSTARRA